MKQASRTVGVIGGGVGGFIVGGPVGAVAGGIGGGALIRAGAPAWSGQNTVLAW
jgi:hypothetical protein